MLVTFEQAFGQVLQEIRQERGLSQEELAFGSGYHRTYISLLERGQKNPSLKAVFRLAAALKVGPAEMIARMEGRIDAMPNSKYQRPGPAR